MMDNKFIETKYGEKYKEKPARLYDNIKARYYCGNDCADRSDCAVCLPAAQQSCKK